MTDTHTPGPWHVEDDQTIWAGHKLVAVAARPNVPMTANARLIAAAPDLLEACQTLATLLDTDDWIATGRLSVKQAQAAIAKATGAQS
jgi:hypothetical protein